jgi:hypothetical protein
MRKLTVEEISREIYSANFHAIPAIFLSPKYLKVFLFLFILLDNI